MCDASQAWRFDLAEGTPLGSSAAAMTLATGMLAAGYDPLALWVWASAGNTLGSAVNWLLGRYLLHFQDRRWFPFKQDNLGIAQRWFQKYGTWSLLLAWAPVGGDALTFIAGIYGMNFENIPELKFEYGYFVLWGVMVVVFLAMLYYFKRKEWL